MVTTGHCLTHRMFPKDRTFAFWPNVTVESPSESFSPRPHLFKHTAGVQSLWQCTALHRETQNKQAWGTNIKLAWGWVDLLLAGGVH